MKKNLAKRISTGILTMFLGMSISYCDSACAANIVINSKDDYDNGIDDGTYNNGIINGSIDGLYSNNIIEISDLNNTGLNVSKSIYGAKSDVSGQISLDENIIEINKGVFGYNIYGAYGTNENTARKNKVIITDGEFSSNFEKNLAGASVGKDGWAEGNGIIITDGVFKNYSIYGALYGSSTTSDVVVRSNYVTIDGGTFEATTGDIGIYGGYSTNGIVSGNTITITDGNFIKNGNNSVNIYGGYSNNGNVSGNTTTIDEGFFENRIYGGYSGNSIVENNTLIINGGTFNNTIYGADGDNDGTANNNNILITGGTFNCNIYAFDGANEGRGNSITLQGGDFSNAIISGKLRNDNMSDTSLIIDGWSGQVKAVERFNKIDFQNFEWVDGGTVIEITQGNRIDALENTIINLNGINFSGGSDLAEQESMYIIKNSSPYDGLTTGLNLDNVQESGEFTAGVAIVGTGEASLEDDSLVYTITSLKQNNQVELVAENRAVAAAFVNQGTDLINDSLDVLSRDGKYGIKTFAAVHGNRSKYDVNSDLKINGWSSIVGVGNEKNIGNGDFSWGVFYENGSGNYRTYNEFNNEFFRGDGSLVYNGGGIAARFEQDNGVYTEGSLRAGMLKSEMTNALKDGAGNSYGYKSESTYYGAHLGVGKIISLNEATDLDVYSKFFHTYTDGDSFTVANDKFEFDSITSDRLRIGARLTTNKENKFSTYYGLAYEYEFNGDADMRAQNMNAPEQSLKGSSCMAEIGMNYKPSSESPWSFDLSMRGYAGQRDGFSGNVQATYTF